MKKVIILLGVLTVSLTSCLKDKPNVDFSNIAPFAEFVHSGKPYFSADAITSSKDTITQTISINITGQYAPTSDVTVGVGVVNSLITQFNTASLTYETAMPANAFKISASSVVVKAGGGNRLAYFTVTLYKKNLDPSKSYMLPVAITSASNGVGISGNFSQHYYHFIGNDFAGAYIWDYRRYNNGTGPGAGVIPSQVPTATDPGTTLGQAGVISPISPTEFEMKTGYNNTGVKYDVTFTKTGTTYSNWKVKFTPDNIALWTAAGIVNFVAPAFTIPPPTAPTATPVFELNYASGASAPGRYIDDTYHK